MRNVSVCQEIVKKLKGTSQKVRRAQILLKADADGPAWTDARIAEAFGCRVQTVENLRERLVTEGFELALERQETRGAADAAQARRRGRGEVDRHAVGQAAGGLRPLDAATAGRSNGGIGDRRVDQPRDGPPDAKKNGMTKRKIEYWVIPPEPTASSSPTWRRCWRPTKKPTIRSSGAVHGRAAGAVAQGDARADPGDEGACQAGRLRIRTEGDGQHLHVRRTAVRLSPGDGPATPHQGRLGHRKSPIAGHALRRRATRSPWSATT